MVTDITFIGGGIAGLLSARLFALAGASVTLIDKSALGQESSWAGGGILLPLYPWRQSRAISELVRASFCLYPELIETLLAETGLDPEYCVSGLRINKLEDIDAAIKWCQQYGVDFQIPSESNALYLPEIAQVRNPRLLKALRQDLKQRGVNIIEHCDIQACTLKNNRITHIASDTQRFAVNQLVITTGAWTQGLWSKLFAEQSDYCPKIKPVKGQMLILQATHKLLDSMILEQDRYLIPRQDYGALCGSTVEHDGFNKGTTEDARHDLIAFAHRVCPSLKTAQMTYHWAGLRPATKQGIPYIDIHPDMTNLAINAGHFRNGFAMGTASAQLLYDLITQQTPLVNPNPYQLSAHH